VVERPRLQPGQLVIAVYAAQGSGQLAALSLQQRLVKTGERLIKQARYYWLLLAESHLTRPQGRVNVDRS
jgi:hypothetical protein